jgi:hypothetical protein
VERQGSYWRTESNGGTFATGLEHVIIKIKQNTNIQRPPQITNLSDSLAIGLCAHNTLPTTSSSDVTSQLMRALLIGTYFLEVNKLFKRLTITADAANVFFLVSSNYVLENMGPTIRVAVIPHHTSIF